MKRGQSAVISSVLLILLVIVIAGIIVVFASGYMQKMSANQKFITSTKKLDVSIRDISFKPDSEIGTLSEGETIPSPTGNIEIIISRLDNEDIPETKGMRFIFYLTSGNTISHDVMEKIPESGYNKPYIISLNELDKLGINPITEIEKIEIQVIFDNGVTKVLDNISEIEWNNEISPEI